MHINNSKNIIIASIYFLLSIILTGIFIAYKFWLYPSVNAMIISGSIAGAKWLIQLVAALLFLGEKKWLFIRNIAFVCFMGSCLLFTYNVLNYLPISTSGFSQFVLAILIAVIAMIILYYRAVKITGLPLKWFFGWLLCLAVAIFLQVTVVF